MPLKITGGSAKDRLYAKAIAAQVSRERREANKKAEQWRDLQVKNMDKGSMPSPRELMSLGGQALTSGPVSDAPSAIQEMRERILEQERQRQEEAKRRALYQVQPEQTAKDLAGMRLEAGDYAQVGGKALTSGTAGSAAQNLGAYKRQKQADTSGPVQVDWMGVSAERNNRIDLLNQKLRELEAKREEQEKKARTSQEEQAAFWDARAKSTGYSVDESDRRSQAQKDAGKTASELKSQERQLGQYIKWLEGQGIQERAENITNYRDVHDGLLTDARGPISDGKNQAAKMLVEAIQARELGENPTGYDAPETLSMLGMADVMTDRQKDTMLAFAGRGDWDGASRYLSSITDTMNQKMADHRYQNMGAIEKALYWMPAGLEQFGTGMSQLGKKETTSPSVTSRISQMVQRDAYETHPALGFAYDMGTSISNMAPSMLMAYVAGPAMAAAGLPSAAAGAVAGGIGSAALGASAGGNAYAEKRRQGYGAEEAAAYATLVGASEAGLQYVLGGISKLGATPLAKAASQVIKIDNAFGQAALKLGANMFSEGVEEGLQSVLEPAFATLILDEKYQVSPQEVVTSFLMGALTAGLLEGPGAVRAGRAGQNVTQNGGFDTSMDGYLSEDGVDYFRNVKNLEDTQLGFEILADYYSLTQQGADTTTMNDVVRQYAMRSAWYEGQEQARRATGQTAQPQQNAPQDAQEAQRQPEEVGDIHGPGVILDTTQATQEQAQGSVGQVWEGATQNTSGAPFQRVQTAHIPKPENLTPGTAGVDNGHRNTQILSEGAEIHEREADQSAAVPEGASAFDGRQGRVYREGPVQQAGGLEEGPAGARQTVEPGRATGGREHLAENLRGQEVSSRQLGLSSGTDAANVLVVPQEMWEPDMVQAAQEVQRKTGAAVTYVLGNIEVAGAGGGVLKVKGVQMSGKIIVQADHPRFTVDQIAAHETFHDLTARDVGMVYEAEQRIKERYNPNELEKIVAVYTEKLRGIVDIPANATPEQMQAAELRIWEELCADAYAGMNAFEQEASRYQETVQEVVLEREAAAPSRENAQATERKTGPTSTSEATQETQRYKEIKVVRDAMRNAYAAGEISEAEYAAAMESIWAQAGVDGEELLEAWDRMDREDGWERFSKEDEETLTEFALGDDGNIYLPGQPVPEAVKRMRAKSLDRDGSSAYDGENQKGAVDYEQGSIGSRSAEIYLRDEWNGRSGANANHRGRERGIPGTLEKGERRDSEKVRGKEESSERYKNAIVEHPKTEGSNRAKIAASQYTKDIYFVKHESIQDEDTSNNRQRWGITTKDGTVLLSDRIPDHLGVSVGVHEAVHVAKRKGFTPYTDFLSEAIERIDQAADETIETLNTLAYARFNKEFMNLNVDEIETVYDELNAYVWGYHRSDAEKTKARFADIFTNYDDYIRELDAIMEQMRLSNREKRLPGQHTPETVQQMREQTPAMNEQANGPEKFSVEDEETLTEFALGDDGNIYLPGQPMPEAVKRMRAAQQKDASVDRNQLESDQREAYSAEDTQEGIVDTLPRKAKDYLSRAERAMVRKLGDLLSVPTAAQRDYLRETVREISEEYLKNGRVSQKAMDRLFEDAYSQGVIVQETLMDEYRELYNRLRSTDLVLAKEYTGDIPDFEAFRRKYFNRLKISTKGRTNIDQVYMELEESYPQFFNQAEHSHPSDQLEHIAKVMDDFKRVERSLDEYYGADAEEFKRYAKHDFEVAVTDILGELRTVKRYADERAAAKEAQQAAIPNSQAEVEKAWKNLKSARRVYEKTSAKNLLTDADQVEVGRLLRGEIQLEHLDPDNVNVKGIKAVYEARVEYEQLAKGIKAWNRSRKEQAKAEADTFLETANDWKDKKAGILYSRETMERNIRDIIKDKALADKIIATYFTPVHEGAAAANRTKNSYRERVRKLNLSRKVKDGNIVSEAHAVQLLGEAEDNIRVLEQSKGRVKERDGKTLEEWNGVVADLWKQNPNLDEGKIRNAIQEFRAIYDDLFQQMNEVRVRNGYEPVNYRQGYFPHFQPGNEEGILAAFGRALGISTEVTALPTTINGLTHTFRPGIRWMGNALERVGFDTAYDAVEGFDRYIEGVADVIHQTDNIQRLRALASQIRYRTGDEGIRRQVDAVRDDPTLSEQDKQNRIEKIYETGRYALSNFVAELDEYTNLLANKKSGADRKAEKDFGRSKLYNFMKWAEKRVGANMVAINPASWLTNFIPLTQGGALLDRGMLLHGMWDTLRAYKGDDGFVDTSSFLTNRRGSDPLVKTWSQKASSVMSKPMEFIDQFTADSLVRARYRQNVKRGMSEAAAVEEADAWVAGVMADRSKGSMPTLFERSNPFAKFFTQFQLEVNNQLSYLFKDMPRDTREKGLHVLAAALMKFALGAFLYNELYEFIVGRRPALDPIGILNDTVGDLAGWELPNLVDLGMEAASGELTAEDFQTEQGDLYDVAEGLAGNVTENLPFIGGFLGGGRYPVMNALPDFQNAARSALDSDWNAEKKLYELSSGFENPLTYLLLPFGGGQLKKIYNGVKAAVQGGKYSVNSDGEEILQYPMFMDSPGESIANVTRSILFGTTSLPTGQEWVEEGFKSLTAEQTVAYKWLMEEGTTGREAFYLIKELREAEKTDTKSKAQQQIDILERSGLNGGSMAAAYYTLVATDREREIMDELEEAKANMGNVTQALMAIKTQGAESQKEVERVLRSVPGLSNAERRMLWQLKGKRWDQDKNPF